jgi:hypothetical protein
VTRCPSVGALGAVALVLSVLVAGLVTVPPARSVPLGSDLRQGSTVGNGSAVGNFTGSIDRIVELLGLAGGGLLALVWARVALSWFSNDVTKKVQAKDRARDALVGTLLFVAAVSGLVWGLAHWVITGS